MTLLTPLALLGALIAIPIVLMYVLKLRRQEQMISSTFLWRRVVEDVQANAPWQRLRPNLLLFLQLLILLALVLTLARPAYTRARAFDGDLVVIVDQSYGMQARDVAPSRFAQALARAHRLASDLSGGNVMSVIGMGAQPRLAIAESDDGSAINRAIDSLHVGISPPNFLAALSLAASLSRGGVPTHVVVLTSRDSGIRGLPINVSFPVEIDRIGSRLRDLGITDFWAAPAGKHTQAVLRISNFGSTQASSDLELFVDGQLADVRPLTVAAGGETTQFWTQLPAGIERLEAQLQLHDDVRTDKAAWAVVPTSSARQVLLVSNGDYFLQTALAINPSVQLNIIRPAAYTPALARGSDLVVFDGFLPKVLPAQSTLLVAPPTGRVGPLQFGAERSVGAVSPVTSDGGSISTLLQYVDLGDVHVARARDASLPDWLQPVVISGAGGAVPSSSPLTLVAAGENGSTRLAVLSFNLQESDWPLRISFPIAMQNVLHFLAPGLALGTVNLAAGQPLKLFPEPGTREIQIVLPDGRVDTLQPQSEASGSAFVPFTDTSQPGLYVARSIGGTTQAAAPFAVNFFPPRTAPASGPDVLRFGRSLGGSAHRVTVPVSVEWAFGLLALALLTAEWWFAFRR